MFIYSSYTGSEIDTCLLNQTQAWERDKHLRRVSIGDVKLHNLDRTEQNREGRIKPESIWTEMTCVIYEMVPLPKFLNFIQVVSLS